jgi:hypothetical protein
MNVDRHKNKLEKNQKKVSLTKQIKKREKQKNNLGILEFVLSFFLNKYALLSL